MISFQITSVIAQIELYQSQIDLVEDNIKDTLKLTNNVIKSVKGIGDINAAIIIGEIGDIKRFNSHKQLVAYSGLDPRVYQSGQFNAASTRMSKRGSRTLRYTIINTAWQLTLNSTVFKNYYDAKRAEGKSHYKALGHVANKLIRVIFKMMTCNVEFNLP